MFDIRLFQVVVPLLFVMYILYQLNMIRLHRKEWRDVLIPTFVAFMIMIVAIAPDRIAHYLSLVLDIKNSVNAILVSSIGILFVLMFRLFELIRRQRKHITDLTIEISLLKIKKLDQDS